MCFGFYDHPILNISYSALKNPQKSEILSGLPKLVKSTFVVFFELRGPEEVPIMGGGSAEIYFF